MWFNDRKDMKITKSNWGIDRPTDPHGDAVFPKKHWKAWRTPLWRSLSKCPLLVIYSLVPAWSWEHCVAVYCLRAERQWELWRGGRERERERERGRRVGRLVLPELVEPVLDHPAWWQDVGIGSGACLPACAQNGTLRLRQSRWVVCPRPQKRGVQRLLVPPSDPWPAAVWTNRSGCWVFMCVYACERDERDAGCTGMRYF